MLECKPNWAAIEAKVNAFIDLAKHFSNFFQKHALIDPNPMCETLRTQV